MVERDEWTSRPSCCAKTALKRDLGFQPRPGPTAERVMYCEGCGARWIEEWMTVAGFGQDDRDYFSYLRITLEGAAARFDRVVPERRVVVRCPKCRSMNAGSVEAIYEFDRMRCSDCGFEELCDEHQIKGDWNVLE